MAYSLNGEAGAGGSGGGRVNNATYCNDLVASGFEGAGGYEGSGGFSRPNLVFAALRNSCLQWQQYKQSGGSVAVTQSVPSTVVPTPSLGAVNFTPLIYLLAILIVVRVVL